MRKNMKERALTRTEDDLEDDLEERPEKDVMVSISARRRRVCGATPQSQFRRGSAIRGEAA